MVYALALLRVQTHLFWLLGHKPNTLRAESWTENLSQGARHAILEKWSLASRFSAFSQGFVYFSSLHWPRLTLFDPVACSLLPIACCLLLVLRLLFPHLQLPRIWKYLHMRTHCGCFFPGVCSAGLATQCRLLYYFLRITCPGIWPWQCHVLC